MNRKWSSLLLLLVLSVTDAYLLAHPNLIGKIGVLVYKHHYIRNFPRALLTVAIVVGISLAINEVVYRLTQKKTAIFTYLALTAVSVAWFMYVFVAFSSFSYRITGKAFIYGAHLLPVILAGLNLRYLFKRILVQEPLNGRLTAEKRGQGAS
ncbi:hypothetical protein GCM10010967_54220 [Dyadobacter beijingensis]|uniref:Rod shape-determining protein MreD n=1 Tax=Dyadobacter beijingensis TaxID=365489 RepID=A0ABQ2IKA7_9BACT|nr:hypothetical protein [Dyadobacter beijingensis]GGN11490.1 hypothetical protein GCM10010967_54220 [Dyadobacter beijingensis]